MKNRADRPISCVFLSTDALDGYVVDDDRAYAAFAEAGISVERIDWRAPGIVWDDYDIVVTRSTWDYTDDPQGFFDVLASIDASRAALANPLEVMRWNARKTYLRDLADAGAPVVPTRWGPSLDGAGFERLAEAFADRPWVIKPIVGANAEHAYALSQADMDAQRGQVEESFAQREWMAQPFMNSVRDEGEFSLFYFCDEFSHAILKTPGDGDFRVQEEHGGLIKAVSAEPALRATGERILGALPPGLLYARIDLVRDDAGGFLIMEIELIEPSMYLRTDAESPGRFAAAVRRWLANRLP